MKHLFGIALAVLISLGFTARGAVAGGDYDYYSGADLFVARSNTPVYDRASPGGYTNIRLRAGSYLYASCWDGWEGWCRIRTRYFKNMYIPRYALDSANGGHRYKSYYYKESGYKDCAYKERYSYKGSYREGCYEKSEYPAKDYGGHSYRKDYGTKRSYAYEKDYAPKANSYEKDYGGKHGYKGRDGYDGGEYDEGQDQDY